MDDTLTLRDTAHLLNLSTQDVVKMADGGDLPGLKRAGRWEFNRRALLDHVEREMTSLPHERLAKLEIGLAGGGGRPDATAPALLLSPLVAPAAIELSLNARSKAGALSDLVKVAEKTDLVWDAPALLESIRKREDVCPTALEGGIAVPHPRRAPEYSLAESLVVFGRAVAPIHYGALDNKPVDLFFLVACTDEHIHLQVLARLCRMLRSPEVPAALRAAETPAAVLQLIRDAEAADLKK